MLHNNILRNTFYILIALFLWLPSANAVEKTGTATVKVSVKDQSSTALPGALVELKYSNGSATTATTDDKGASLFSNLPSGTYEATVTMDGFQTLQQKNIAVHDQDLIELQFKLVPKLSESVNVSGESVSATERGSSPATELKPSEVKNLPNRPGTVADALPLVPGVVRSPEGQLRISGAGEHHSAFVVNSVDVTDPATGRFGLTVPIDSVESLSVFKSPYLAEFGRFTSGVVAVETRRGGDKWDFELNDPLPEFRIRSLHLHGLKDFSPRFTMSGPLISHKLYLSESVEFELENSPVKTLPFPENETKKRTLNSFTQLDYLFSPTHTFTGTLHASGINSDFNNLNFFNPRPVTPNFTDRSYETTAIDKFFFGRNLLESTLAFQLVHSDVTDQGNDEMSLTPTGNFGNYYSRQNRTDQRLEWRESFSLAPVNSFGAHNIKFGTSLTYTSNEGEFFAHPVNIFENDGHLLRRIDFVGGSPFDRYDLELVMFGQDHWVMNPDFALDLGMRFERQGITETFRVAPRLGFVWTPFPNPQTAIRGGIGIFYDRVPLSAYSFDRYPEQVVTTFGSNGEILDQLHYQNITGQAVGKFPFVHKGQEAGNFSPYSNAWNIEFEHPFSKMFRIRVNYLQNITHGVVTVSPQTVNGQPALVLSGGGQTNYRQFEIITRLSLREDRTFYFSYVRSSNRGTQNDFTNYLGNFPFPVVQPDQIATVTGDLPNRFLFWGEAALPKRMRIVPMVEYRSGFPYSYYDEFQDYVGEPNSHRFRNFFSLDMRVSKDIPINEKYTLRFSLSGFNLTDRFNPLEVHSNVADPRFGLFFGNLHRHYRLDFDVLW